MELSPIEDIYAVAGIANPRGGYSVNKVVDMLHSEHIRGLSTEMKRAAVLMALDAAGVTIGQIQQDAKTRQNALDAYEAEQRKQAEAEWARKAEENIQIQSDLERVKAQYMARIARNEEGSGAGESQIRELASGEEAGEREHDGSGGSVFETDCRRAAGQSDVGKGGRGWQRRQAGLT